MRIEDKLSRTLEEAVQGEPLPKGVWEAFERRARRAQRTRIVIGSALAAVAVIAALLVVPRISSNRLGTPPAGSPSSVSNSKTMTPRPVTYKTLRVTEDQYAVTIDSTWSALRFEGTEELLPPSAPSLEQGKPTLAIAIAFLKNADYTTAGSPKPCLADSTCRQERTTGAFNARKYVRFASYSHKNGEDGNGELLNADYFISWPDGTLRASIIETSGVLWAHVGFEDSLDAVVKSAKFVPRSEPYSGWVAYKSASKHFTLKHPKDWKETGFEGGEEFDAPGQTALARGASTFAIEALQQTGEYNKPQPGDRTPVATTSRTINGRPYVRYEYHNGSRTQYLYRFDWTGISTCPTSAPCAYTGTKSMLQVSVTGSTANLWDMYNRTAVLMVESIKVAS